MNNAELASTIADRILIVEGGHTGTHIHVIGAMEGAELCYRARNRQDLVDLITEELDRERHNVTATEVRQDQHRPISPPVYRLLAEGEVIEAGHVISDPKTCRWYYIRPGCFGDLIGKRTGSGVTVLEEVRNRNLPGPESETTAPEPENSPSGPPR